MVEWGRGRLLSPECSLLGFFLFYHSVSFLPLKTLSIEV